MVIEEAKILNKPIIITNTAAREAVENYKKATIVENSEQAIYNKLREIIINDKCKKDDSNTKEIESCDRQKIIIEQIEKLIEG